jgi:hypothetical protein
MNIFNKRRLVSLADDSNSYLSAISSTKIVEQRDANLKNLKGNAHSTNRTELAIACLADADVLLGYERFVATLQGFNYTLECSDDDAKSFLQSQLDLYLNKLLNNCALARITGISALEIIYEIKNTQICIKDLLALDSSRIVYELDSNTYDYNVRFTNFRKPFEGEHYNETNFVIHRHWSLSIDSPYGVGIGGQLGELVQCKTQLQDLWLKICNKYSEPIISITVPQDTADEELDAFFETIKNLKNSARFVLPEGYNLDIKDPSPAGLSDLIIPLIERLERQIIGLLVGESLTAKEVSNGSNARDIVARDIGNEKALAFAAEICNTINNQFLKQLLAFNYPKVSAQLKVSSPENLAELLNSYEILKRLGCNLDTEWLAEKFDVKLAPAKKVLGTNI